MIDGAPVVVAAVAVAVAVAVVAVAVGSTSGCRYLEILQIMIRFRFPIITISNFFGHLHPPV